MKSNRVARLHETEKLVSGNSKKGKILPRVKDSNWFCHARRRKTLYWDFLPAFSDIGGPSLITISKYRIQKYKIKTTTVVVFTVSYTYSLESHLHI